eukprot:scaffold1968_cov89-Skeletonema_dohrnii-CCMP3373.AAC.7
MAFPALFTFHFSPKQQTSARARVRESEEIKSEEGIPPGRPANSMSVDDNNSRQAAVLLLSKELLELCKSDSLSEEGLREIIERHGNIYHRVSDYKFFRVAAAMKGSPKE